MVSLRARLVAAVLVLSAAGLLLLGAITYAEQRSFLLDRVDQQVTAAPPAAARALAGVGIGPSVPDRDHDHGSGPGGDPPPGGDQDRLLPPGTYVERRNAAGEVIGSRTMDYGQTGTTDPNLPADIPTGRLLTVHGKDGDDTRYRVYADADPSGFGTTVVALPLSDVDRTLHRLLAVEALVIGGVLLLLAVAAWAVVRVGLLPLDRMGHTAAAIAGGDLSHRVETTDQRTEVGRLGLALNRMLDRLEDAFAAREASQERLRRFIADASHELRTPLVSIRGYAELFRMGAAREPEDVAKAMRRIEDEAARMGVLVEDLLMLARLDEIADAPPPPRCAASPSRRPRARARRPSGTVRRSRGSTPAACAARGKRRR